MTRLPRRSSRRFERRGDARPNVWYDPCSPGRTMKFFASPRNRFALILAAAIVNACGSDGTPGVSGPQACAAAGGTCLIGPGIGCARVGPQDCNPDRNPGGAYCCLQREPIDAGTDAADTSTEPTDGSSKGDVSDAPSETDVTVATDAADAPTDALPFCSAPLSRPGLPSTLSDVPFASWCASNPGRLIEWSCGGAVAVTIGIGVD